MARKNRAIAILLVCILAFVALSSVTCIAINAKHDCVSENCRKCAQLIAAGRALERTGALGVSLCQAAAVLVFFTAVLTAAAALMAAGCTLVSLKVKLSN